VNAAGVLEGLVGELGSEWCACVAEELLGDVQRFAMHIFGSSLICRLLEVAPRDAKTAALVDELLAADMATVVCHKFGHAVAMSILSHGMPHQRSGVASSLRVDLQRFARHRFASLVVASAFGHCSTAESHHLARLLMSQAGAVASLACHGFGVRVVRAMLELPGDSQQVMLYLQKSLRRLQKDKFGAQLLQEMTYAASV